MELPSGLLSEKPTEKSSLAEADNKVEGGNPKEHYPDAKILKLAQALWVEGDSMEVFEGGLIKIHKLSLEKIKLLLGIDHKGEAVNTGFRFSTTLEDGTKISSNPDFLGVPPIPTSDNTNQTTTGTVNVDMKTHHEFIIQIECFKLKDSDAAGDNDLSYSITIMPDPEQTKEEYLAYYDLLAKNMDGVSETK